MPILGREPDVYPDDLLNRPELGQEPGVEWWALYTLARREKQLMRRLRSVGIPFYAPCVPRRTRSPSGRVRMTHDVLFAGYVFLYADSVGRREALTTNCISRCLHVPDGTELTQDLRQIRQLIEVGAPLTPEARLEPGSPVQIRSGVLRGLDGVVIKRHNQSRLLVAVHFLQQGVSVLFDDIQLEAIR
jgi:transcriptional antiterminator RfaH